MKKYRFQVILLAFCIGQGGFIFNPAQALLNLDF